MNSKLLTLVTVVSFGCAAAICLAEKAADLKPAQSKAGKVLVEENFAGSTLGRNWNVAKGTWQVRDGAVVGKEKTSDKHAAVMTLTQPNRNSIIRFSFKLDGAKAFNLSFNHAKGHLFRIAVDAEALTINKDKDKKDPKSKVEQLGKVPGKFPQGQWFTMLVEINGANVAVQTDNGVKVVGSHPGLDVEKTGYR
ncbi:MAG: DUF1080 domain-containing protein, partial [Verrucomicrobia bacterium]|nr:DUF1080 domain-containing protein [Verrucomicrobiota bacterium]